LEEAVSWVWSELLDQLAAAPTRKADRIPAMMCEVRVRNELICGATNPTIETTNLHDKKK
jgi:hypothetical protein